MVFRRIGGLEIKRPCQLPAHSVFRRIGGLEIFAALYVVD